MAGRRRSHVRGEALRGVGSQASDWGVATRKSFAGPAPNTSLELTALARRSSN